MNTDDRTLIEFGFARTLGEGNSFAIDWPTTPQRRTWSAGETEAILAESLVDQQRLAEAAPHASRAFAEYRTNAWMDSTTMGRLFDAAVVIARHDRVLAMQMFDAIGHSVVKLRRTRIGELEDKNLRVGEWRKLTEIEVKRFKKSKRSNSGGHRRVRGLVR